MTLAICIATSVAEIYILSLFYSQLWELKRLRTYQYCIGAALYMLVSVWLYFTVTSTGVSLLATFLSLYCVTFFYKAGQWHRLLYAFILFIIISAVDVLTGLLLMSLSNQGGAPQMMDMPHFIEGISITKFLDYVVVRLFAIKSNHRIDTRKKVVMFLVLPISSTFIIFVNYVVVVLLNDKRISLISSVSILLLIVANLYLIHVIERSSEMEYTKQRLGYAESLLEREKVHFNNFVEQHKQALKFDHDVKNALFSVTHLLEDGNIPQALEKIHGMTDYIAELTPKFSTGNFSMDALLEEKVKKMQGNHIAYKLDAAFPPESRVNDIDLCIVVGNVLDNAIEACMQIPEGGVRHIYLRAKPVKRYLSILVENSTADSFPLSLKTNKENPEIHGFGIQNVTAICERYDGGTEFEKKSNTFSAHLSLLIQ